LCFTHFDELYYIGMKKILLVEDDPFIRDLTTIKLSEQKYTVLTAENGDEAIRVIRDEMPDIVLLDLDLPDTPGLAVLQAVKADSLLQNIPVIIFSNNDDPVTQSKARELGTEGFFIKASTAFEDLHTHIKSIIGE
jgi:DNA-binding response OmpR family regulator